MPELTIATDDLWPRTLEYRYRLYLVAPGVMDVIAATPTAEGIGTAIVQLHDDARRNGGNLSDGGRLGVLDVCPGGEIGDDGDWVVLPFDRHNHI